MRNLAVLTAIVALSASAFAQTTTQSTLSKADRIFIQHGLQIHALGFADDPFDIKTLKDANFTGVNWGWRIKANAMGRPPGEAYWNFWAGSEKETALKGDALPYARKLIAFQLRDEQDMNKPDVRAAAAKWFDTCRRRFPNTILYSNQYGGQVTNENMGKYWEACKPD